MFRGVLLALLVAAMQSGRSSVNRARESPSSTLRMTVGLTMVCLSCSAAELLAVGVLRDTVYADAVAGRGAVTRCSRREQEATAVCTVARAQLWQRAGTQMCQ
jgi:hypothetical protein